jgi:hypothetical protein
MTYTYDDKWPVMRHYALSPITFIVYVFYAFGFWVHHSTKGDSLINKIWHYLYDHWMGNDYLDHSFTKFWFYIYGVPFITIDILYNVIIGTLIWLELPRLKTEKTYTKRLKRKKIEGHYLAWKLCYELSIWDPKHC